MRAVRLRYWYWKIQKVDSKKIHEKPIDTKKKKGEEEEEEKGYVVVGLLLDDLLFVSLMMAVIPSLVGIAGGTAALVRTTACVANQGKDGMGNRINRIYKLCSKYVAKLTKALGK